MRALREGFILVLFLLLGSMAQGQAFTRLEYFIDNEPGIGQATNVPFSGSSDTLNLNFLVGIQNLNDGFHNLYVRILDSAGMWSPWQPHLFFIEDTVSNGDIDEVEYLIDTDPGIGLATDIGIVPTSSLDTGFVVPISSLSTDNHVLQVRQHIAGGYWSPWQLHIFRIVDTVSSGHIDRAEYFIDTDSGFGLSTNVAISIVDSIDTSFVAQLNAFSTGNHMMHVRQHVSSGYWSPWQLHILRIDDTVSAGKINEVEYFIDTDSGFGSSSPVAITLGDSVDTSFTAPIHSFESGNHIMHVRQHVSSGYWSPWQLHILSVVDTVEAGPIQEVEYFIDEDPGVGNADKITIQAGDTVVKRADISSSGLQNGLHFVHARNRVATGYWSPWQLHSFYIQDTVDRGKITSIRHVVDSSLHDSSLTGQVDFSPKLDSLSDTLFISTDTGLVFADHVLRIWAQQEYQNASTWHFDSFLVIDCPMLDSAQFIQTGNLCQGDTLHFRENITSLGVWPADTFAFSWFTQHSSSASSQNDSFDFISNTTSDTLFLRFKFARLSENRCKGERVDTILFKSRNRDTLNASICEGDSLLIFGSYESISGNYILDTLNRFGCDSVVIMQLVVNPVFNDSLQLSICDGDSALIFGDYKKIQGTYDSLFSTQLGCDSFVHVFLEVYPIFSQTDSFEICSGDTLFRHGKSYTQNGNYLDEFQTFQGCDSSFISVLKLNPVYDLPFVTGLCGGDSLFFGNQFFNQTGIYPFLFQTNKGCDSLVTLDLTVDTVIHTSVPLKICLGDSILLDGQFRQVAGQYQEKYQAKAGCDSLVDYSLTIIQPDSTPLVDSFCLAGNYSFFGQLISDTGIYYQTLQGFQGCDSVLVLRLFNYPSDTSLLYDTLCFGGNRDYFGQNLTQAGEYRHTLSNRMGCDSVLILSLFIRPLDESFLQNTVCYGDSLLVGNGFKKGTGQFIDTLINRFGCDSIIHYDQTERPLDSVRVHFDLCDGQSIFTGNSLKTGPGIYIDTLNNAFGCDSILISEIGKLDSVNFFIQDTICFGANYSFFGQDLSEPGAYTEVANAANGCDSIVHLFLFRRSQFIPEVVADGFAQLSTDTPYVSYQWYLDRDSLQNETNRVIVVALEGVYDVSVRDNFGCPANSWDELLSNGKVNSPNMRIYPNPASSYVRIESEEGVSMRVMNGIGQLVYRSDSEVPGMYIDCSSWMPGVYYLHLQSGAQYYFAKLVVIH